MTYNTTAKKKFSAIILAAGLSSRIGQPKLALPFNSATTFLEHIIQRFATWGCAEIIVVVNCKGYEQVVKHQSQLLDSTSLIINLHPERQKFYSLQLAVKKMEQATPAFIQNIDNPFINWEVLNAMKEQIDEADYILPEFNQKGGHPVLISSRVVKAISIHNDHDTHLKHFLRQFPVKRIKVEDEKILTNINTNQDYRECFGEAL